MRDGILTFSSGTSSLVRDELANDFKVDVANNLFLITETHGRMKLRADLRTLSRLAIWLRTTPRVYLLLYEFRWKDKLRELLNASEEEFKELSSTALAELSLKLKEELLDQIYSEVYSFFYENPYLLRRDLTFAVRSKRLLQVKLNEALKEKLPDKYEELRLLKTRDIEAISGKAIIDSFLSRYGHRLKVNLEEPHLLFRVEVFEWGGYIALDLVGVDSNSNRGFRVYHHPAAMKGHLAACGLSFKYRILEESKRRGKLTFHDPMCGGGTIPIELLYWYFNLPPSFHRWRSLALWEALRVLDEPLRKELWNELLDVEASPLTPRRDFELDILASDISPKHLRGAELNLRSALKGKQLPDGVRFRLVLSDVSHLEVDGERPLLVVTNPPYGIRYGSPKTAVRAFRSLIHRYSDILDQEGILVVFTPRVQTSIEIAESMGFKLIQEAWTLHGDLPVAILAFRKV